MDICLNNKDFMQLMKLEKIYMTTSRDNNKDIEDEYFELRDKLHKKDGVKYVTYLNQYYMLEDEFIPEEVKKELLTWKVLNQSPFSRSFYNFEEVDWDFKENGSLRLSDHWNFLSRGKRHCIIKDTNPKEDIKGWKLAKYENGYYIILKEYN